MRKAVKILSIILAALVVVQAMSMVYAITGLFRWVDKDGGELNKAVYDSWEDNPPEWQGSGGYGIHVLDGMFLIPLVAVVLLIVSMLANRIVAGAALRGTILFGMVILQVAFGMFAHDAIVLGPLHALNAFGIFAMSAVNARKAAEAPTPVMA
jgi:hypothetical protein